MKFFVSRQLEYPDNELVVEIVSGGLDYANPGMMGIRWASLGEGKEFLDPREAVAAAIAIRNAWQATIEDEINISFGSTGGFTMPLARFTDEQLGQMAEERYQKLPKCARCSDILNPKRKFHHTFSDDEEFCSENCADRDYENTIHEMERDRDE